MVREVRMWLCEREWAKSGAAWDFAVKRKEPPPHLHTTGSMRVGDLDTLISFSYLDMH